MEIVSRKEPLTINLSLIPKDFGMGRLEDDSLIFDNLDEETNLSRDEIIHFPVKVETFFSIVLVQGTLNLMINLQEVKVVGGQVLVIMPGSIFQMKYKSQDIRFFCLIMNPEFTEEMRKNLGFHLDLTKRYYNFSVQTVGPEVIENGLQMYKQIKRELSLPDYPYKREVIQRLCEIWTLKNLSTTNNDSSPEVVKNLTRKEQIFHDFLTLLEENYMRERSVSYYADRMCLTPKYLSTIIKEVSGKHGMQWIDEYVTLEAKALLRNSVMSVKEVSDQLNFPSQSMFGRFFKKMTGYSPKQYKLL